MGELSEGIVRGWGARDVALWLQEVWRLIVPLYLLVLCVLVGLILCACVCECICLRKQEYVCILYISN